MELVESEPRAWLALHELAESPWVGDDPLSEDFVPAEVLEEFNAHTRDFRWKRIEIAARSGALGQAAWADVEWVAQHDRTDVVAATMLLARQQIREGTLVEDPMLWSDIAGTTSSRGATARGLRREASSSRTSTPRVLRALTAWRAGLHGDVLELLDAKTFEPASTQADAVAQGLRALASLATSHAAPFKSWLARTRTKDTVPLRAWSFAAPLPDTRDTATTAALRGVRRDWASWDATSTPSSVLARVILDPQTPRRAARRARATLRHRAPRRASAFELCQTVSKDDEPCRTFFDDAGGEYGTDLGFVARRAPEHEGLDAGWLSAHRWSHDLLFDLAGELPKFDATSMATDAEYQELAVRSLLAAGRFGEAAARLQKIAPMLATGPLVSLTLAVREPVGEAPDQVSVWLGPLERPKDAEAKAAPPLATEAPRELVGRIGLARELSARGQWADAAVAWSTLASEFGGRVQTAFAARAATAAAAAGNAPMSESMARIVNRSAPQSVEDHWVRGVRAWVASDQVAARTAFERVLALDPSSDNTWRAILETSDQSDARPPELLGELAPEFSGLPDSMLRAIGRGDLAGEELWAMLRALTNAKAAWEIRAKTVDHPTLILAATEHVLAKIHGASDPSEAVGWAEAGADYLQSVPSALRWRDRRLRLLFLAGRSADGLRLARFDLPEDGLEPLPPSNDIVLLLHGRAKKSVSDALAWTFFEWLETGARADEVAAFTRSPIDDDSLLALSCGQLVAREELDVAAEICARAWAPPDAPWRVAVDYAYVLLEGAGTKPEAAVGFFADPRLTRAWDPLATLDPERHFIGLALQDHAIFKERTGDFAGAAALWINAYALSDSVSENSALELAPSTFALRGALARTLAKSETGGATELLPRYALMDGASTAARAYAKQTLFSKREGLSAQRRTEADRALHLAELVAHDVEHERLPTAVRPRVVELALGNEALDELEKLHKTHPESHVTAFALAGAYVDVDRWEDAGPLLEQLAVAFPGNPWIAVRRATALAAQEQLGEAKRVYADARAAHPDAEVVLNSNLPTAITGEPVTRISWMRSAKAFRARVGQVDTSELLRLSPRYRSHTSVAADGFFPAGYTQRQEAPLTYASTSGQTLAVVSTARASRCEARGCLDALVAEMKPEGYRVIWVADVELPGGSGAEALLVGPAGWASVVAIPAGGRVFGLFALSSWEDGERPLPAIALLRRSFSVLDRIADASSAAQLRVDGKTLVDVQRLRGRLDRRKSGTGCPLGDVYKGAEGSTAAELLLDSYLAAPDAAIRRRLTKCTPARSRAARRIALLALLDPDAAVHAFGRAATGAHGIQAMKDYVALASTLEKPPTSSAQVLSGEWTPHAWIEVIANLPPRAAEAAMRDWLASPNQHTRVSAWTAASIRPELVVRSAAEETVRSGTPTEAQQALKAWSLVDPDGALVGARDRLGREPGQTRESSRLVATLARRVASGLDPQDTARFRRAAKRLSGDTEWARTDRARLEAVEKAHVRAIELARSGVEDAPEEPVVDALLAAYRDAFGEAPRSQTTQDLETRRLAELLEGPDWVFARVANPGLFAATASSILARLRPDDPVHELLFDRLVQRARTDSGLSALAEGAGLELTAPIECASPADSPGFVCSATVADRNALLSTLERRRYGVDAGASLPLRIATTAGAVPLVASAAPLLVEHLRFDDDDDEPTDEPDEDTRPAQIVPQRVRLARTLYGHQVEFYATIRGTADSVSVDAERYLFVGDRVFVMSSAALARHLLTTSGAAPLSSAEAFRKLTKNWKDGSALQAVALGSASLLPNADASIETVVDETGLRFRYAATTDAKVTDITAAEARLPDGAVSQIALGLGPFDEEWYALRADAPPLPTDVVPPFELTQKSPVSALGWYPRPKDTVWQRWVAVLERTADTDALAKRKGIALRSTPTQSDSGFLSVTDGNIIILASDRELLDKASARADSPPPSGSGIVLGRGSFTGKPAAAMLAQLPTSTPTQRAGVKLVAAFVDLVEDVHYEAVWDPATKLGVLEGRVSLHLREGGETSDVVDRWLASAPLRNAAGLPRRLADEELETPLRFRLRVPDGKAFAQSVLNSERVTTTVLDATHVELNVLPDGSAQPPKPLTERERARALRSTWQLQAKAPTIRKRAAQLVPEGTNPRDAASAVTHWVHASLRYEVTPRTMSATKILRQGRGDCSEYAALTVSLLRAAGVPAEVRSGMAASERELVAHAWVAYHDGERWNEVDPTFGRASVTSGHLPLSVVDLLALLSLGRLEIEAIDRAP